MKRDPLDGPERPEIVNGETPTSEEGWHAFIRETAEELIVIIPDAGGVRQAHLSARTFPGGYDDHDGEVLPYCYKEGNDPTYEVRDPMQAKFGFCGFCQTCLSAFKRYHDIGKPTSNRSTQRVSSKQAEFLEGLGITIDDY